MNGKKVEEIHKKVSVRSTENILWNTRSKPVSYKMHSYTSKNNKV